MTADRAATLRGRRVVTTRAERGRLDRELARLGADVVHVPLIGTAEPDDGGAALAAELAGLDRYAWVVVTSPNGAERVAPGLRAEGGPRVGVVGSRTAAVVTSLAGRRPDVVPDRQTALDLVAALPPPVAGDRLLLAQADRADPAHAAAFADRGYDVTTVVAYRTVSRPPTGPERRAALTADAVAFASGSAVEAWHDAFGGSVPPVAVAIGPSTAVAADRVGVKISHVAADHSVDGLVAEIARALRSGP